MNHWLFQGNPKFYRVVDGIRDFDELEWLVKRHGKDIAPGDDVAIWVAGTEAGIYALAEVTSGVRPVDHFVDESYWHKAAGALHPLIQPRVAVRFTSKLLDRPLLRRDLKEDAVLKDLLVIRVPNGTNFRVTEGQWDRIQELCAAT